MFEKEIRSNFGYSFAFENTATTYKFISTSNIFSPCYLLESLERVIRIRNVLSIYILIFSRETQNLVVRKYICHDIRNSLQYIL